MSAPTLEIAAQVLYEGLSLCVLPEEVREALAVREDYQQRLAPVWRDLAPESREFWIRLLFDSCTPVSEAGKAPPRFAVIRFDDTQGDLFTQAVAGMRVYRRRTAAIRFHQ